MGIEHNHGPWRGMGIEPVLKKGMGIEHNPGPF